MVLLLTISIPSSVEIIRLGSKINLISNLPECTCSFSEDMDILTRNPFYISTSASCIVQNKAKILDVNIYHEKDRELQRAYLIERLASVEKCFLDVSEKELIYKKKGSKPITGYVEISESTLSHIRDLEIYRNRSLFLLSITILLSLSMWIIL